ncbi:MAG TPA: tripartite tricarboxylate transporter substrate binding protein [Beijerinckiaceae bacterium]|jgi:tripartite-type tricarboxylate transporter receptor subunit TctC
MPDFSPTRRQATAGLLSAAAGLATGAAFAQGASSGPITFIVPFSAGSGPDTIARLLGQHLGERWKESIIVDNRAGASGNIGTAAVARAKPDGATMLVTANTLVMNVSLFKSVPYDPVKSFEPVAGLVYSVFACAVHKKTGANSLQELVALAKKSPGGLNFGSPGLGAPHHVGLELFKQQAGVDIKHVPHAQLASAMQNLSGGHIDGMFLPALQAAALAKTGDVKVLAISGDRRIPLMPDVPTMDEAGVKGVDIDNWWAILAPAGTDPKIVERYNTAINEILDTPEMRKRLEAQALQVIGGPPSRLRDMIAKDMARWSRVLEAAGVKPE